MFENFGQDLVSAVVLLIIPGVANTMPVFAKRIDFLKYPIDGGFKLKGKRILGDGKTWRGLFFGVIGSGLILGSVLYYFFKDLLLDKVSDFEYLSFWQFLLFSILISFGGLAGDMVKSFFKRRVGIERGQTWFVFDQLDWVFGAVFVYFLFFGWNNFLYCTFFFGLFVHLIGKFLGFILKIDSKPI